MSHSATIPLAVNPSLLPGSAALMGWLLGQDYAQHYREAIGRYAARHGELAGAVQLGLLDREDEETAEWIFVESLPEVPYDDPAWDRPDVFLDVAALADGSHPVPFGEPDEATLIGHEAPDGRHVARKMLDAGILPVAGGSPTPTEADRADFEAWLSQVDAPYPPDGQAEPRGYTADTLARINRALYGQDGPHHA